MTEQDKILLARGALLEVLGKHDVSKISDFFTELSFTTPIRNKPIRKKCLKFG